MEEFNQLMSVEWLKRLLLWSETRRVKNSNSLAAKGCDRNCKREYKRFFSTVCFAASVHATTRATHDKLWASAKWSWVGGIFL